MASLTNRIISDLEIAALDFGQPYTQLTKLEFGHTQFELPKRLEETEL